MTMKYDYGNKDSEYVFCYKSRPFAVLVSSYLPTPNSSFVDHLLVNELGLKMSDIQCKKISFGGKKLRLLGRVSCTVQCVKDGRMFGNFNFKACVSIKQIPIASQANLTTWLPYYAPVRAAADEVQRRADACRLRRPVPAVPQPRAAGHAVRRRRHSGRCVGREECSREP